MAKQKVVITLQDGDDGHFNVNMTCEPMVDLRAPTESPAVMMGMIMLDAMASELKRWKEN